jgi:hypothetical protein
MSTTAGTTLDVESWKKDKKVNRRIKREHLQKCTAIPEVIIFNNL